jgi:hypothetical protein
MYEWRHHLACERRIRRYRDAADRLRDQPATPDGHGFQFVQHVLSQHHEFATGWGHEHPTRIAVEQHDTEFAFQFWTARVSRGCVTLSSFAALTKLRCSVRAAIAIESLVQTSGNSNLFI